MLTHLKNKINTHTHTDILPESVPAVEDQLGGEVGQVKPAQQANHRTLLQIKTKSLQV